MTNVRLPAPQIGDTHPRPDDEVHHTTFRDPPHEGLRRTADTVAGTIGTKPVGMTGDTNETIIARRELRCLLVEVVTPTIEIETTNDTGRLATTAGAEAEVLAEEVIVHRVGISAELKQHYHVDGLDDIRIIRDRQTKVSRQFGFLRFSSLQDAESFMDGNYPFIYLYGHNSNSGGSADDAKVHIAFGRERKEPNRGDDADWICRAVSHHSPYSEISMLMRKCNINNYPTRARCFRCQAHRNDASAAGVAKVANVGDGDVAPDNTPSQFLLLRGLELSVSEELLAKGVSKLFKPAGPAHQPAQASKKGAKVASTTGDANLGAKEGTLRRILLVRDRRTNESWRFGFAEFATIEDAQAALTRYNSFDRFTIASKPVLVSYIHAGVFVPVTNLTASIERFTFSPLGNPSIKLTYWDDEAYVTELIVSKPEPTPESKSDANNSTKLVEAEGLKSNRDDQKSKKRKAEIANANNTTKKAVPSHLQFWSNRHAELHGLDQKDPVNGDRSDDQDAPPSRSYADPTRHCCYLCLRQFNSAAEVNKHERLSDLHRHNLKDEEKVKKAQAKLEKHGIDTRSTAAASAAAEYRDRAKERRKIYGVVNKKGEQVSTSKAGTATSTDEEEDSAPQLPSKGASLLGKMGYTAGQGLGASGEGRTAPISQDIYVAGVGLGAQGGKMGDAVQEAERNTRGDYAGFAERTRELARDRYARMTEEGDGGR